MRDRKKMYLDGTQEVVERLEEVKGTENWNQDVLHKNLFLIK